MVSGKTNLNYDVHYSESESHSVLSHYLWPHGLYSPWSSQGQNTKESSLSLLWGIFPTQGSNPGLPRCRRILYQLSHKRSLRIWEWVAYPFPVDLPHPGIKWGSPALQADSLPTELSGKPIMYIISAQQMVTTIPVFQWMIIRKQAIHIYMLSQIIKWKVTSYWKHCQV